MTVSSARYAYSMPARPGHRGPREADGKPVAGSEVTAVTDGSSVKGRTDGDGRVTLKIDREGAWLIRAVHMVRLSDTGPVPAEWESFWVTLSFHTARR